MQVTALHEQLCRHQKEFKMDSLLHSSICLVHIMPPVEEPCGHGMHSPSINVSSGQPIN